MIDTLLKLQFDWPWAFAALALPWLVRWIFPAADPGGAALQVPFADALESVGTRRSASKTGWYRRLALLGYALLVVAAARPVLLDDAVDVPVSGRDIMLAIDISASMGQRDWGGNASSVTRMSVVQHIVGEFISRRQGDRIGMVVFGSQAYLLSPLTFDVSASTEMLRETVVGLAGPATAMGDAIGLTIKRLREADAAHRVVIVISDGATNAGWTKPEDAIRVAIAEGVTIYTIGVGSFSNREVSKSVALDEDMLRALAERTGGRYFLARGGAELEGVNRALEELEPAVVDDLVLRSAEDLYPWALLLAFAIGVLMLLIAVRR